MLEKKLTINLTIDQVKEAVWEYVEKYGKEKVKSITLEMTKLNEMLCLAECETVKSRRNKKTEQAACEFTDSIQLTANLKPFPGAKLD